MPGESHGERSLAKYSPWGRKRIGHDSVSKQPKSNRKYPTWEIKVDSGDLVPPSQTSSRSSGLWASLFPSMKWGYLHPQAFPRCKLQKTETQDIIFRKSLLKRGITFLSFFFQLSNPNLAKSFLSVWLASVAQLSNSCKSMDCSPPGSSLYP